MNTTKKMNKVSLNWKNRAPFSPVVGFNNGEEAIRPSGLSIELSLESGVECKIEWHVFKLNSKEIEYQFQGSFSNKEILSRGLTIISHGCLFSRTKYLGYVDGKKAFLACSGGILSPILHFSSSSILDEKYGKDTWQTFALLCWWHMYRD